LITVIFVQIYYITIFTVDIYILYAQYVCVFATYGLTIYRLNKFVPIHFILQSKAESNSMLNKILSITIFNDDFIKIKSISNKNITLHILYTAGEHIIITLTQSFFIELKMGRC